MSTFFETLILSQDEIDVLLKALSILKDVYNDLYAEDGEDTDECMYSKYAWKAIEKFLATQEIKSIDTTNNKESAPRLVQKERARIINSLEKLPGPLLHSSAGYFVTYLNKTDVIKIIEDSFEEEKESKQ